MTILQTRHDNPRHLAGGGRKEGCRKLRLDIRCKNLQAVDSVAYLSHGNNGVRDGRSNVGT